MVPVRDLVGEEQLAGVVARGERDAGVVGGRAGVAALALEELDYGGVGGGSERLWFGRYGGGDGDGVVVVAGFRFDGGYGPGEGLEYVA